jgi:hypothetical protein
VWFEGRCVVWNIREVHNVVVLGKFEDVKVANGGGEDEYVKQKESSKCKFRH